jgi:hypothetical protein
MGITLTTPTLLFPAISQLLLALPIFLSIASLIRQLHSKHIQDPEKGVVVVMIKN